MARNSRVVFLALIDVPDTHVEEFRRWRDEELIPTERARPGFLSVRCFEAVDDAKSPYHGDNLTSRFFHMYEVDDLETLRAASNAFAAEQTDWSKRVHENMKSVVLNAYVEVERSLENR